MMRETSSLHSRQAKQAGRQGKASKLDEQGTRMEEMARLDHFYTCTDCIRVPYSDSMYLCLMLLDRSARLST
jgi:hypothetical protein